MWDLFQRQAKLYMKPDSYTLRASQSEWKADPSTYDAVVLGGGSLLAPSYIDKVYEALLHQKPIFIWGSGIDKLVEKSVLESMLHNRPLALNLTNSGTITKLKKIMHHARFTAVRGPLTRNFLCSIGCNPSKLKISGDPGFLLKREDAVPVDMPSSLPSRKKVIGINWGTVKNGIYGRNETFVEDQLASVAKQWIRQGYSILLYVMWPKDILSSRRLMEKIGHPNRVQLIETVNPYQIMHLVGYCHFTVNYKLHASVFSAVMGVPFIALGYRFKVFDFAASIDSLLYTVSTDEVDITERLLTLAQQIKSNYPAIVQSINRNVSKYGGMLTRPFFEILQKEVQH